VSDEPLDLLLIGCGLRGTGLLTAAPQLLSYRTGVVEASDALGPGAFADYRIESNSFGNDFFGWIDSRGVFGEVLEHPEVRALRATTSNFRLPLLARALRHVGAAIAQRVPEERLFLRQRVERLEHRPDSRGGRFVASLSSGKIVGARALVLATGIRETLRAELAPWRRKVLLSSEIIKGRHEALFGPDAPSPVVILGGSHSGYSVAMRFAEALAESPPASARRGEVVLLHRSPVKLFHASWADVTAIERAPLEAIPDPGRDVCPASGHVFRYSGLRHGAKALFLTAARRGLPWLRQLGVSGLEDAAPWLERAAVIVQAMGYESNTLPVCDEGGERWSGAERLVVQPDGDGCLALGQGRVFVMGMDPYPYRDNSLTPTGQYALRGKQILAALARAATVDR
jgi:hypothetical protein